MPTPRGNPDPAMLERELARLGKASPHRGIGPRVVSGAKWAFRVIGRGENPIHWAFSVGTVAGVPMRMHLLVVFWALVELTASASRWQMGAEYALAATLAFVFIAMVREAARIAWAQRHAAVTDMPVIWPLGALNAITQPSHARGMRSFHSGQSAGLHCEMGGMFVGIALVPVFIAAALLSGVPAHTLWRFPFFSPADVMGELNTRWQYTFWWLHYANTAILLANLALVAPCFDAGRVLARAMRDRRAANRAAITLWAGLASALVISLLALGEGSMRLAIVALVAALCTWLEFRSQVFLANPVPTRPAFVGLATSATRPTGPSRPRPSLTKTPRPTGSASGLSPSPVIEHPARPSRAPLRTSAGLVAPEPAPPAAPRTPPTREQIDEILAQITREGLPSLSQEQRDALDAATRHLRAR